MALRKNEVRGSRPFCCLCSSSRKIYIFILESAPSLDKSQDSFFFFFFFPSTQTQEDGSGGDPPSLQLAYSYF
jgi:hypothetical protein